MAGSRASHFKTVRFLDDGDKNEEPEDRQENDGQQNDEAQSDTQKQKEFRSREPRQPKLPVLFNNDQRTGSLYRLKYLVFPMTTEDRIIWTDRVGFVVGKGDRETPVRTELPRRLPSTSHFLSIPMAMGHRGNATGLAVALNGIGRFEPRCGWAICVWNAEGFRFDGTPVLGATRGNLDGMVMFSPRSYLMGHCPFSIVNSTQPIAIFLVIAAINFMTDDIIFINAILQLLYISVRYKLEYLVLSSELQFPRFRDNFSLEPARQCSSEFPY